MIFSSVPGTSIQEAVRAIMAAQTLNKIIVQPTTKTMNIIT